LASLKEKNRNHDIQLTANKVALSVNMRTAIGLLELFVVAIFLAILGVPAGVRPVAAAIVTPVIVLSLAFIYNCRKRKAWSYAGGCILGAFGIVLRLVVSTQPNLEPAGGVPVGITALYIALGALVSLKCYESLLELRTG